MNVAQHHLKAHIYTVYIIKLGCPNFWVEGRRSHTKPWLVLKHPQVMVFASCQQWVFPECSHIGISL